jgi:hypothetical protein
MSEILNNGAAMTLVYFPSKHRDYFYPPNKEVRYARQQKPEITCPSCAITVSEHSKLDAYLLEVHPSFMASVAEMIQRQIGHEERESPEPSQVITSMAKSSR